MTAIAAVFRADGRESAGAVRRMLDAAAHRGSHPSATWSDGPATLGHRASAARGGPARAVFASGRDGNAIVFDGRLDNRDDLLRALAPVDSLDDPALVLAAYAKWSDDTPAFLLGDFAFALWDARRRRLLCARDAFGQRPLFYAAVGGAMAIASEPQQLLAHPAVPAIINEGAVAEFLACALTTVEETFWTGLTRLAPAHAAIVSDSGVRQFRYWDLDPEARVEYPREEDYAAHFTDLFRTAIACRTRGAASVGVFLSGGLDSSGIAGTAQMLARERGAPSVRAFSLTFPGPPRDETPYIDAVVRQWGLPSVRLAARPATREEMERDIERYRDVPTYPNGSMLDPLRRRAAADVDVVLTGYGGDDWFTGSPLHTADLLREGRVVAAARQYRHDIALPGRGYSPALLLRAALAPLLPRVARAVLRPLAGAPRPSHAWIRSEFAARAGLSDRIRPRAQPRDRSLVQSAIRRVVTSCSQVLGDELEDRAAAAAGLEQGHPFFDRRLAEFGFALPESQRWAQGETKVVIRRALAAVLPPSILRRNDKAEFSSTFVGAIESLGGRDFFSRLHVVEAGWVDARAIQSMYDEMAGLYSRGDEAYSSLVDPIWSVAAVELWLNQQKKEQCR